MKMERHHFFDVVHMRDALRMPFTDIAAIFCLATEDAQKIYDDVKHYLKKVRPNDDWRFDNYYSFGREGGRPRDMGGPRDAWLTWTPESNSRELGIAP